MHLPTLARRSSVFPPYLLQITHSPIEGQIISLLNVSSLQNGFKIKDIKQLASPLTTGYHICPIIHAGTIPIEDIINFMRKSKHMHSISFKNDILMGSQLAS
jgi:hypothetical protein